jgi:hypothetical protein
MTFLDPCQLDDELSFGLTDFIGSMFVAAMLDSDVERVSAP